MANDDEFRKVAEDVRALARSLAHDFRDAVDRSRDSGQPIPRAFRHGVQGVAEEARRGVRSGLGRYPYHHYYKRAYRRGGWWGDWWDPNWLEYPPPPPGAAPSSPPGEAGPPGADGDDPDAYTDGGVAYSRSRRGRTAYRRSPYGPPPQGPSYGPPPYPRRARNHQRGPRRAPLPPVRRRWDATTVAGLLAVLFGVAWLLGAIHAFRVPAEGVVAVGLMILGASLVVTGRTDWSLSRHAWPVWLGAALIAVLLATSTTFGVGGAFDAVSFGHMSASPAASGTVHGGFGRLDVDASAMTHGQTLHVDSVAGITAIEVPGRVPVEVNARVLAGQICIDGQSVAGGVGATAQKLLDPGPQAPLVIDVHQVAGQIEIGGSVCQSR